MASHAPKLEKAKADLDEALKSGDKQAITKARDVYERTAKNITVNNKRFKDMREETCAKLSNLNETALNYINSNMPKIYTMNYNAFGQTEKIAGYSFALVNENAVKNLVNTGDLSLYKHVDVPKDKAWNEKFINSQVTQGILQGESIDKISKRVFPEINRFNKDPNLVKRNENSAIRIARTMTTAAENKGRQDSFKKANSDGVEMEREWLSAHDAHVRAWHRDLSGVKVGIDEPWENDYGEIMYPGDPTADPANVYNCRCSIRAHVKGFKWNKVTTNEALVDNVVKDNIDAETARINILRDIETQDHMLNYERGAVVSNNGEILARYDGTTHAVEVSDEDLKLMEGATFTHNHPSGGFFSDNDIITGFTKTSLGELRASTPQGIIYSLVNNGATKESARKYLAEYQQTSMRARRAAQEHFVRQIKAGELSMEEYQKNYFVLFSQYRDEKLIKMTQDKAEEYGFIFKVEKNEK